MRRAMIAEDVRRVDILKKILEEIENGLFGLNGTEKVKAFMSGDETYVPLQWVKDIIRKHMNDGWIPVEKRLPEESLNSVIGWDDYRERCCFVQYLGGRFVLGNDDESVKITAWQPLPEPYRPEKGEKE